MISIRSLTFIYTLAYLLLLALLAITIRWFDSYPKDLQRALDYQQRDIKSVQTSIRFAHKDLTFLARDYSSFPIIRNLVANPTPKRIASAKEGFEISLANLDYFALIKNQQEISAAFYKAEGKEQAFEFSVAQRNTLRQRYLQTPPDQIIEDFALFNGQPVMVSIHPIKDLSKLEKPVIGRIIMGSRLYGEPLTNIAKKIQTPVFANNSKPIRLRDQTPLNADISNQITPTSTRCLFDNNEVLVSCFTISHNQALIPKFFDWQSFSPFVMFALIPIIMFWLTMLKLIRPLENFTLFLRNSVISADIKKIERPNFVSEIEQFRITFNELCDIVNQQKTELKQQAKIDQLTQIANRRAFDYELERNWNQLGRNGGRCALVICDLDFFKLFNDHYGHLHGDKILKLVAETLEPFTRRSDEICARFGGEEFILIMHYQEESELEKRLKEILSAINQLQEPHSESRFGRLTLSLGICTLDIEANELINQHKKDWIKQADDALYEAKEKGRNQYILRPFVFINEN